MSENFGGRFAPPVREGEEIDLNIEAVGEKGDGIAKKEGFVIFVPNTQVGQNVKVKVTKVLRKVAFGEAIGEGSAPAAVEASEETDSDEVEEDQADEVEEENKDSEDF
jgi:predicted RNA-binding protein with TRAM domain